MRAAAASRPTAQAATQGLASHNSPASADHTHPRPGGRNTKICPCWLVNSPGALAGAPIPGGSSGKPQDLPTTRQLLGSVQAPFSERHHGPLHGISAWPLACISSCLEHTLVSQKPHVLMEKADSGDWGGILYLSLAHQPRGSLQHGPAPPTSAGPSPHKWQAQSPGASSELTIAQQRHPITHGAGGDSGRLLSPSPCLGPTKACPRRSQGRSHAHFACAAHWGPTAMATPGASHHGEDWALPLLLGSPGRRGPVRVPRGQPRRRT